MTPFVVFLAQETMKVSKNKYDNIPRILNPILSVANNLPPRVSRQSYK